MKKIEIRPNGTKRVYIDFSGSVSKTDQSQAKQCDINEIIKKYKKTGQVTHLRGFRGTYADISDIGDLQESIDKVQKASDLFSMLPAETRKKFENNPTQLFTFLQDPKNKEEAIKLGLIEPQLSQQPIQQTETKKD